MRFAYRRLTRLGCAGLNVLLLSCGGGSSSNPVANTAPTSTPAPVATAAPTAAPAAAVACGLPPVTAPSACDRDGNPVFLDQVDAAVAQVQQQRPELFEGQYVVSPGRFYLAVIANLQAQGFCAGFDGEEIQVKNVNAYSEQYHLLTSGQIVRRGAVTWRATCRPAAFPAPTAPLGQRGDCSLPSSREVACAHETPRYLGVVQDAIAQLQRERPTLFDGDDVRNWDQYYDGLVAILRTKMTCAIFDGEEIAVKNENSVSEQYHVLYSWGQIRKNDSAYRVSCYPAAF
jgi:hypothetical protein